MSPSSWGASDRVLHWTLSCSVFWSLSCGNVRLAGLFPLKRCIKCLLNICHCEGCYKNYRKWIRIVNPVGGKKWKYGKQLNLCGSETGEVFLVLLLAPWSQNNENLDLTEWSNSQYRGSQKHGPRPAPLASLGSMVGMSTPGPAQPSWSWGSGGGGAAPSVSLCALQVTLWHRVSETRITMFPLSQFCSLRNPELDRWSKWLYWDERANIPLKKPHTWTAGALSAPSCHWPELWNVAGVGG